ncbi:MAG: helix-turn-helix transcriptional regulator [Oscillospiraceae bacterium]|nr:helix-turn-helix transcriptional regulator [Oscillospiraceae bacterium]
MKKGNEIPTKKPLPPPPHLEERKAELEMRADKYKTKELFRKRRKDAQHLTMENLAEILGVNVERVKKWCYKGQLPEAFVLIRLAVALDCDADSGHGERNIQGTSLQAVC